MWEAVYQTRSYYWERDSNKEERDNNKEKGFEEAKMKWLKCIA